MDGNRCPRIENAPRTGPGVLTLRAVGSPGVWNSGGMGGVTGLNWSSVKMLHDDEETWPEVRELARAYESGAMAGAAERAARDKPTGDDHGG